MYKLYKPTITYDKLEQFVSKARLHRYLLVCNGDKKLAIELYAFNIQLSQAFYPIISLFEVFLRNIIHINLAQHFNNPDWIVDETNGFMNDQSLKKSKFFLKYQVISAKNKIAKQNAKPTSGKIVAELGLGFWTSLFDRHHYRILRGKIIHCFPNRTKEINRKYINESLNKIRKFRNRIYHNEPICFKGEKIGIQYLSDKKNNIHELLNWISPDLKSYTIPFDGIDNILSIGKREFNLIIN